MPRDAELRAFRNAFGVLGEAERRNLTLVQGSKVVPSNDGKRVKVIGLASVYGRPSVEMRSPLGTFTEYIERGAFDRVLRSTTDVPLLWDHDTRYPLASTGSGTLELSSVTEGLRYFASVPGDLSYAQDLRVLMENRILSGSSFSFSIAPEGEEWEQTGNGVVRTIHEIGELYDVTVCQAPAYPDATSGLARSLFIKHAVTRGLLDRDPDVAAAAARLKLETELRRRRLSV